MCCEANAKLVDLDSSAADTYVVGASHCRVAVQAFAAAIAGSDGASQDKLISYMSKALNNIARNSGCDTVKDVMTSIAGTVPDAEEYGITGVPAVTSGQMQQLCGALPMCSAACTGLVIGR